MASIPTCLYGNCDYECEPDPEGGYFDYCCMSHMKKGLAASTATAAAAVPKCYCGKPCKPKPAGGFQEYCSPACCDNMSTQTPKISMAHQQIASSNLHTQRSGSNSSANPNAGSVINFYNRGEPFFEFTNFYKRNIRLDGFVWPTTEHFFQAQKFSNDPELMELIRRAPEPREAFSIARQLNDRKRLDWDQVRESVMLRALRAKFHQHIDLSQQLSLTGDAYLVEHTANDKYWGDGGDGSGQNRLGHMLMQVRGEIARQNSSFVIPS